MDILGTKRGSTFIKVKILFLCCYYIWHSHFVYCVAVLNFLVQAAGLYYDRNQ